MKIDVIIDNQAQGKYIAEHGLALLCHFAGGKLLFDTGAGHALLPDLAQAGIRISEIGKLVLSHGHYDHTGGLEKFLSSGFSGIVYYGKGMEKIRYSIHPDRPVKALTIPDRSLDMFRHLPGERKKEISAFTEIDDGFYLTGRIPHISFEDRGGPFFLDKEGKEKDEIDDEISLLTADGLLIQGCCHAGIINTLEHCKKNLPRIPIRFIAGGLHLLYADEAKLAKTAEYLNGIKTLEKIILLHCTGENAVKYLQAHLSCQVVTGKAGDSFLF